MLDAQAVSTLYKSCNVSECHYIAIRGIEEISSSHMPDTWLCPTGIEPIRKVIKPRFPRGVDLPDHRSDGVVLIWRKVLRVELQTGLRRSRTHRPEIIWFFRPPVLMPLDN